MYICLLEVAHACGLRRDRAKTLSLPLLFARAGLSFEIHFVFLTTPCTTFMVAYPAHQVTGVCFRQSESQFTCSQGGLVALLHFLTVLRSSTLFQNFKTCLTRNYPLISGTPSSLTLLKAHHNEI